ncbi:recombinase family protein [Devosia sp. 63-57]|uniref:recombinase family protein n=1 Tax=Devosia sp. 63-57 TaxID=1895751 RepID=UPI00086F5D63|nr:recombinase family protein [Devosia sp. 63-57]ODT47757.1 MAG: resolvase [Pelagibacterium sp. SCN 63-126]OJX42534.1 MAG: resolvase [Devosia sp. 63-57]
MIYGYARVSTDGQTLDAQREALICAGADEVFAETASGAKFDRAELAKVLALVGEGDTLVVTRLDRLARSTINLLSILDSLSHKRAMFRSLSEGWADTTTPHGRLTVTIVGGVAEFERELIRARTGEGRSRAKARGQSLGRRPALTRHQQDEVRRRKLAGEAVREIARSYNVSASTISRIPS